MAHTGSRPDEQPLRVIAALFFLSGISGLMYQVIWLRMLLRAFGVGVYAVTTVVAVFMIGLAIGAWLIAQWSSRPRDISRLRLYGILEVIAGIIGAASSVVLLELPEVFRDILLWGDADPTGLVATALRILIAMLVLLPPTILMGATLPLLSGHVTRDASGLAERAGLLYGVNTLGAVVGTFGCGFFYIALLGEVRTVLLAAGINLFVGAVALWITQAAPHHREVEPQAADAKPKKHARLILFVAGISGFCSLCLEVVWERLLSPVLGNSVYGFSSMLGAYLVGISVGAAVMARFVARLHTPMRTLGWLLVGAALTGLVSIHTYTWLGLTRSNTWDAYATIWALSDFWFVIFSAFAVVVPVTLFFGAMFPVAGRLIAGSGATESAVGRLYSVNTLGAILGTLVSGFVLVPIFGTLASFLFALSIAFVAGVSMWVAANRRECAWNARGAGLAATVVMLIGIGFSLDDPFLRVLEARVGSPGVSVRHAEALGVTVTDFQAPNQGPHTLYINGVYVSNEVEGLGEQMLNVPLMFNPDPGPKKIFSVGLGVGDHLRYAVEVGHHITIAELHAPVVEFFRSRSSANARTLESANARIVISDGRNYLLHSHEKFDLIFVDGSPPAYAAGMGSLYAREFVELARQHLNPNGMVVVWFPVICFERDLWSVMRNFADVFPAISLFTAPGAPNAMMMGSVGDGDPFAIDAETQIARYSRYSEPSAAWMQSRTRYPLHDQAVLRTHARQYAGVTDDRPSIEFPLQPFLRGEVFHRDNRFLYPDLLLPAATIGPPRLSPQQ